jgi:hypothetical protein
MTDLCDGGTSEPVTGYTGTITLDGTSIAAYLALIGEAAAAETLAPLIAGAVLVAEDFCGSDPPADPGISSSTVTDALNFTDPATSIAAIAQIKDWFLHSYWCKICTCATGPAPTCGTPSSPGTVTQNPGVPGTGNAGCFDNTFSVSALNPSSGFVATDITNKLLPTTGVSASVTDAVIDGRTSQAILMWEIPPGITGITFKYAVVQQDPGYTGGAHLEVDICFGSETSSGQCNSLVSCSSPPFSSSFPVEPGSPFYWPSGSTYYAVVSTVTHDAGATGVTEAITVEMIGACSGPALGCCPPPPTDPNISSRLDQIYGLLTTIYSMIPEPVTTYVAGTVHSGLSGGANLSLDVNTIAILVVIDTLPSNYGLVVGFPNTYFNVGWLTPTNDEGPTAGIRISRATETFELPQATSAVDYSLPAGQIITITELQAG